MSILAITSSSAPIHVSTPSWQLLSSSEAMASPPISAATSIGRHHLLPPLRLTRPFWQTTGAIALRGVEPWGLEGGSLRGSAGGPTIGAPCALQFHCRCSAIYLGAQSSAHTFPQEGASPPLPLRHRLRGVICSRERHWKSKEPYWCLRVLWCAESLGCIKLWDEKWCAGSQNCWLIVVSPAFVFLYIMSILKPR